MRFFLSLLAGFAIACGAAVLAQSIWGPSWRSAAVAVPIACIAGLVAAALEIRADRQRRY